MSRRLLIAAVLAGIAIANTAPRARAVYREDFESTESSWRMADTDAAARITYQQRNFEQFHSGHGSEQVQIAAGRGTYARLMLPIEPTRVIRELQPSLWLKADRAGIQFMLRVVLPRSRDSRTGEPLTTLLYGDSYHQTGGWQRLGIADVVKELERQERVLRTQFRDVDTREAYIDLVVLNAYGGAGLTTLWIDELTIAGHAAASPLDTDPSVVAPTIRPAGYPTPADSADAFRAVANPLPVEMQGSVLTVAGRPFMPRIIDHNDEPLEWLKSIGFNTVKLRVTPSPEQLSAAETLDIWLIAPPPRIEEGERLGASYGRVLAWSLGRQLGPRDVRYSREWADQLRSADDELRRPLVCSADSDLWAYSQIASALIVDQSVLGSSFPLRDYEPWLRQRRRLIRGETPLWAAIQTEAAPPLQTQIDSLLPTHSESLTVEPNQIRLLTYAAAAAGARGIYFRSHSPLNASTPAAEQRARALQMINAELTVLEPWCAGGSPGPTVDSGDPDVRIATLQTERSQILLITRIADDQQFVASVPHINPINFVLPGASGAGDVFQITSSGLLPLNHRRGTGGVRVVVDTAGLTALVLVARDQLVLSHVAGTMRRTSREFPMWRFEEATRQFSRVRELGAQGIGASELQRLGRTIELYLNESQRVLATGDGQSADRYLVRAESALAQVRRAAWEDAASQFPSPLSSPLCASFETLPLHWQMSEKLRSARWSANMLAGGDFEDLNHTLASGWEQTRRSIEHVESAVEFSLESPQSGRGCLRMQAWGIDQSAPTVMESAPLWITSGRVPVERGQLVRIHGWAKVPEPMQGTFDGLMIVDSFGGQPLAERIQRTNGWREFLLYRSAPEDGDLRITFVLTGLGEAWLDGVTVTALPPYATMR